MELDELAKQIRWAARRASTGSVTGESDRPPPRRRIAATFGPYLPRYAGADRRVKGLIVDSGTEPDNCRAPSREGLACRGQQNRTSMPLCDKHHTWTTCKTPIASVRAFMAY